MWSLILVVSWASLIAAQQTDLTGHKVIELKLQNDEEAKFVENLGESYYVDFWIRPNVHRETHIRLSPAQFGLFTSELTTANIQYKVIIEDVQKLIDEENKSNERAKLLAKFRGTFSIVGQFSRHSEINTWLSQLSRTYSAYASVIPIGKSYEGRTMMVLKLSTGGGNKPAILMDAGIHAREWLGVATLNYVVDRLIKNYESKNQEVLQLFNKFDLYFLPVVNPDGYDYTFYGGQARYWRKTRKPYGNGACYGADPNRNFDSSFGGASTSSDPCSDLYRGPSAFSEIETANVRDFVLGIKSQLKLYLAIHTYSQLWFVPWGYTSTLPQDNEEMLRVAKIGNQALYNVNGVRFELGSPPQLLYAASGGAYDWVKQKARVPYSYTFELRPGRNLGLAGFSPPASQIAPSGAEIYAAFIATAQAIRV